jgi:hypothetical protein
MLRGRKAVGGIRANRTARPILLYNTKCFADVKSEEALPLSHCASASGDGCLPRKERLFRLNLSAGCASYFFEQCLRGAREDEP